MKGIIDFIKGHFSGYALFLILLSAFILIFIDSPQLRKKELKKEGIFSLLAGIVYIIIAFTAFLVNILSSGR